MTEGVDVLTLTASPIPRTLEMALTGIRDLSMVNTPPADRRPILTYVGEYDDAAASEAHPPRAPARGPGLLRPQPGRRTSTRSPQRVRGPGRPRRGSPSPTARWTRASLEKVVLDFWEGAYDVLVCTTIIESGIDMPIGQHPGRRPGRPARSRPAPPAPRPGRSRRPARLRLPVPPGRPGPLRAGLRAAADDRRPHRARVGLQDRHARPRDPRCGQPARSRPVGPHRRRRLRPLRPAGGRGGGRAEGRATAPSRSRSPSTCPTTRTCPRPTSRRRTSGSRPTGACRRCRRAAEVDDVRAEWEDRFGPPPAPAAALLDVALLRTECIRLGITDVSVAVRGRGAASTGGTGAEALAKISPITLPASAEVRLTRLVPGATVQADLRRLLVPMEAPSKGERYARQLVDLLDKLVPAEAPAVDEKRPVGDEKNRKAG